MDDGVSDRGKYRLDDSAGTWLPMRGELNQVASTLGVFPIQRGHPPVDPFADAGGLCKFNIGLVPASVTPPHTWKRAAWFAVLASAGVLIGLAFAAKLVGNTAPVERIGMPGSPVEVRLLIGLPTRESRPLTSFAGVPNRETPVVDGSVIAARTERFYEEFATNSDTAMAMATEVFRSTNAAVLEQLFADVSLIEVTEISVDPMKGVTTSLLQVTRTDGRTTTERRELTFTKVGDPLVDAERLTGVG